ncbi:MAG: acyl-CoA dehydrogenase family protein [Gammaproteobacteria bacterium]|nr:MAG: acyl-CoA dehydrogenase family protein [Gammaproteobacteria bacterium]
MDFSIPDDIQSRLDGIREFVDQELVPLERHLLAADWDMLTGALDEMRARVQSAGWWAPNLPVRAGGTGADLVELGLISEELGRTPTGHYVFGCQAPDAGNAELLLLHGSEEQRNRYLEPLASGRIRSCFCMTEPEYAGSNPVEMGTVARRDGDDYVIDGHKWFATAADGARFAIVMAVTNPGEVKHRRASMILVDCDQDGFSLERNIPVMGHPGSGYFSHGEVRFTGCRVPVSQRLGEEGAGFIMAQERLGPGRIHHCMRWLGICRRVLELMCDYALTRQLNSDTKLADTQIVQAWIAESAAELRSARALVLETAWIIQEKGFKTARDNVSMIKFITANTLQRIVDRAIQVHGALGVTDDTILSFWYREERAARIYDGPDEVHKLAVARHLLKARARTRAG